VMPSSLSFVFGDALKARVTAFPWRTDKEQR
jgi:hypothetical protein